MADPTPPVTDPTPPEQSDTAKILENLNSLNERLDGFDEKFTGLEEKMTVPAPAPANEPQPGWKPDTWDDVPKLVDEKARAIVQEENNKIEQERLRIADEEDKSKQAINEEFDRQLAELEKDQVIPPIKDANDPNDPGRLVRQELFGLSIKSGSIDLIAMADILKTVKTTGMRFDARTNQFIKADVTPSGINAPVGSSSAASGASAGGPSYKEIHNSSMDALIHRAGFN